MTDRPNNCRNALRDAGKPYPKSGCAVCKDGGLRGCPYERGEKVESAKGGRDDIEAMVPNGWVLVPKIMTESMRRAAECQIAIDGGVEGAWERAIANAPKLGEVNHG